MAGDTGLNESITLLPTARAMEVSKSMVSGQDWGRVIHYYGPHVVVGEIPPGVAKEVSIPSSSEAKDLDFVGKLGFDAFCLRESNPYKKAKSARPYQGAKWDSVIKPAVLPPDHPPGTAPTPEGEGDARALSAESPTSERLVGSVAVGIIIVAGPGNLDFSSDEQTKVVAEVQNGLSWLGAQSYGGNVTFTYDIHTVTLTLKDDPKAPEDQMEAYWRNPAMVELGYTGDWDGVLDYVNHIRTHYKTDWAYCGYFTKYSTSWFAYAKLGGPRVVMQYSNDDWGPDNIDRVFAHETGHIFTAPDEYAKSDCNCTDTYGYFSQLNGNCANCSGGGKSCIMNSNDWAICHYTPWHLGFRWPNAQKINNKASTPESPAACVFNNKLYLFWKADDPSNSIYYSPSSDGLSWPNGQKINNKASTPESPAACVFNNKLYLFWKANDPSNSIYYSASGDGVSWPNAQKINNKASTPESPAACVFNNKLYIFWKADDSSNSIYYSASGDGVSWPNGQKTNNKASTPESPAACVFNNKLYLFWKADDPSNSIYYSASGDGVSWPNAQKTNNTASTPKSPAACVFSNKLCLFWKANDLSNSIYYSGSSDGESWPNGQKINYRASTPESPAACVFAFKDQDQPYLFWKANDPSRSIYFSP